MKINDDQTLISVVNQFGRGIPIYDDGYGPLWIHRDSMGISGVVRARTQEDAYSICEDEFFPAADEEATEKSWSEMTEDEQNCWDERYSFRSNGRKEEDGSISYIYAKDLNGDSLEPLTDKLIKELELTVTIATS